jgi:hypothetical protein
MVDAGVAEESFEWARSRYFDEEGVDEDHATEPPKEDDHRMGEASRAVICGGATARVI